MFTPSVANKEIEAVAYRGSLEIRGGVEIARDELVQGMRCTPPGFWVLHSLQETHTLQIHSKNTRTVYFYYLYTTPAGAVKVSSMIYIFLPGNEGTDCLFINNLDRFRLERVSPRFSRQHEERYIDPNQVQLNGLLSAVYFMRTASDRKIALYTPDTWAREEKKDKYLFVSEQETMEVKLKGRVETYLTFLEPEQPGD